jgi:phage terminase small subunit
LAEARCSSFPEGFETMILPNPRHERFAQELAKGHPASKAYVLAGYKQDDGHASRLAGNGNVLTRVAEILERAVVRTEITIERLTEMYLQDRAEAYKLGQLAVAKGAIDSLAKLHGLWIERSERKNINASDDEQLDAELRRLRSEAAEIEASRNSRPN